MRNAKYGTRNGIKAIASQTFAPICIAMVVVLGLVEARPVNAQEAEAQAQEVETQETQENEAVTPEQASEPESARQTIDLGSFQVKDLRATSNETASLTFSVHLAFDQSVDKQTAKRLEHWQHRFRDQVIVAIRLSETTDFVEPSLKRFRRNILLRANRALKTEIVSEALLTEFTFTMN